MAVTPDKQEDTFANPKVIVEILSPATEGYDRAKFDLYRELPALDEYVLVSQDKRVETLRRTPEGDWRIKRFEGPDAVVSIHALGVSLPLAGIYAGVPVASGLPRLRQLRLLNILARDLSRESIQESGNRSHLRCRKLLPKLMPAHQPHRLL